MLSRATNSDDKYGKIVTLFTTLVLAMSGLVLSPAKAAVYDGSTGNGTVDCSGSTFFTISNYVVQPSAGCIGHAEIPEDVTGIADYGFQSSPLTSVTIPESVTSIGRLAFNDTTLTSVTIPASVTSIGRLVFYTSSLTSINVHGENSQYSSIEGVLFNKDATTLIVYPGAKSGTSYTIPAGVETLYIDSFDMATLLTSVTIPASVTTIEDDAFDGPTNLASFYFLGNAPIAYSDSFDWVAVDAKAYIKSGATGFDDDLDGDGIPGVWYGLIVEIVADSDADSSVPAPVITNSHRADKLGTVYFQPLSSDLSNAASKEIKRLVNANPAAIYKVIGYVQKSGSSKNNASLSLARAKAIETYLVSLGAGVNFTVVLDAGLVPAKNGTSDKARKATLFTMTPVVQ